MKTMMVNPIQTILMKMLTTFYRRVVVVIRLIDDTIPEPNLRLSAVITPLREENLPDYLQHRPDTQPDEIRTRIALGDECFAAWHKGRIVHSGWVATGRKFEPYLRCTLILQPDEIFLYDHYTHPSFRGHGLAQARDIFVLRHYRERGYRRSLAVVAVENKRAFHPFEAIGYLPIGMFKCLWWILGVKVWQQRWGQEPLPPLIEMRPRGS